MVMTDQNSILKPPASNESLMEAVKLAKRGWHLVPFRTGSKNPGGFVGDGWQNKTSCDPAQIERWIDQHGRCNWGLLLGPKSGIWDLEYDTPEGREIIENAVESCGGILTPSYSSAKSVHRLFQYDERVQELSATNCKLFGTEWRFGDDGHQSVIPPSVHESGAVYTWLSGLSPDDVEVARLPDELYQLFVELRRMDDQRKAEERKVKQAARKTQTVVPCRLMIDGTYTSHVAAAEAAIDQIPFDSLLVKEGWTHHNGDEWTRPGKDWSNAKSATLSVYNGQERLTVWTNAAPIEGGTSDSRSAYSKWRFWYQSNGYLDNEQIDAAKAFLGEQKSKEIDSAYHNQGEPVDTSKITGQAEGKTKSEPKKWQLQSGWSAVAKPAPMRSIVIEGLARRGEVVNIVAATKIGKSWLALLLLLCISTGRDWLGRRTTKGRVLLLDNELHSETIQNRIHAVATAAGIIQRPDDAAFDYVELRGESVGIGDIEYQLSAFQPGDLTLIVMDAKYRFFGNGMEENSNDDQTSFHNAVDRLAKQLNCVIVLVHHSTKGDQSGKSVVDVGSGGGSQARAADCHLILRTHEDGDDLCVLDAALRTFKKVEPQTLRWEFPLWTVDESVEPTVKQAQTRSDATNDKRVKTKITSILQMLRLAPGNIHSENKLSGNHAGSLTYRSAIAQLQEAGEIEWVDDFKEPRAKENTGGWRLVAGRSEV